MKCFIASLVISLLSPSAFAAVNQLAFEKTPDTKTFAELTSTCEKKEIDGKYLSDTLQPAMFKRATELDTRGVLAIYIHCASDADKPLLLEKISNELLMAQPRALIEGLVAEKTNEDFLKKIAGTNHPGFDLKSCDLDCLKKEQKNFEDRMEMISDLPLNSVEEEKRNYLLHEMRLGLAEVKKAQYEIKNKKIEKAAETKDSKETTK